VSAEPALFTDPRRLIVDCQQAKAARQRQLAELFAGPLQLELSARTSEPVGAPLASRRSGGFDGGARRTVPVPISHEQWLLLVLLHARAHRQVNF
jgi:hypothetical protein